MAQGRLRAGYVMYGADAGTLTRHSAARCGTALVAARRPTAFGASCSPR